MRRVIASYNLPLLSPPIARKRVLRTQFVLLANGQHRLRTPGSNAAADHRTRGVHRCEHRSPSPSVAGARLARGLVTALPASDSGRPPVTGTGGWRFESSRPCWAV